jgi:SAM-dependent methyltransferase
MPPQMWAFLGSMAAGAAALAFAVLGEVGWAAACLVVAIGAGVAARVWSHRAPAPMPHWIRWVLFLPRTSQSADRLKAILQPQPGERLLEIGPGVGIHALPVGAALALDGILHVLDIQRDMLQDLRRRAARAALKNLREVVGDAQRLPYPDCTFDAAYLISVLGEVPDEQAALRELHRVLKPRGRLVVGEIVVDPDFISVRY